MNPGAASLVGISTACFHLVMLPRFGERYVLADPAGRERCQTRPLEFLLDSGRSTVVIRSSEHKVASSEHKVASSEHKVASSEHKVASSEHKVASSEHKAVNSEHFGPGSEPDPASLAAPVRDHRRVPPAVMRATILALCRGRFMSLRALAELLARSSDTLRVHYISRLVRDGQLDLRFPDRPNHPDQEYRTSEERA